MHYSYKPFVILLLTLSVIILSGCSKDDEGLHNSAITWKMINEIRADSLESYVEWMQDMGTRFALSANRRAVAGSIMRKFKSFGYTDVKLDSFQIVKTYRNITYQQWQYNVTATLEAGTTSDSICVIGGHYDNTTGTEPFVFSPGANDNASGVAAALEIARVMKKNDFVPANTIQFVAFGAEEFGLYGGIAWAENARSTLKRVMLMLNNDMIAYEPDTDMTSWYVNIMDYDNSHFLRSEANMLCRTYTSLIPYNDNKYRNASDSYPFFLNGFRALFFFSKTMDPNYHTVNDLASNCNFEYCSEIVKLNCAILAYKN